VEQAALDLAGRLKVVNHVLGSLQHGGVAWPAPPLGQVGGFVADHQ
jgi:hypothetical protein